MRKCVAVTTPTLRRIDLWRINFFVKSLMQNTINKSHIFSPSPFYCFSSAVFVPFVLSSARNLVNNFSQKITTIGKK